MLRIAVGIRQRQCRVLAALRPARTI